MRDMMGKKNEWWIKSPPKFKYKIAKSRMEKDGRGWKVRPKTEEEIDSDHIVSETVKRKRETAMWAKLLDGKTFT